MNEIPKTPNLIVRPTCPDDQAAIGELHARAFGPGRFARSAYRLREAADSRPQDAAHADCSQTGWVGDTIAAAVTMTPVAVGDTDRAMLLGPVVVAPVFSGHRFGEPLVRAALEAAKDSGFELVILVGDFAYYGRFGFQHIPAGQVQFPGPVDPNRILAIGLNDLKISDVSGLVAAAETK